MIYASLTFAYILQACYAQSSTAGPQVWPLKSYMTAAKSIPYYAIGMGNRSYYEVALVAAGHRELH